MDYTDSDDDRIRWMAAKELCPDETPSEDRVREIEDAIRCVHNPLEMQKAFGTIEAMIERRAKAA